MGKVTGFKEYARDELQYRPIDERIKDYGEIFVEEIAEEHLQKQGARCMDCGIPFCQSSNGCPVDNLIPEWNNLVYQGDWKSAYLRLVKTNNFPEFTGRVCPAPCESACVLGINSDPVTIKNIEQNIIDYAFAKGWVKPTPNLDKTGKKVAIVGSGPAGLAAADELNQKGHEVSVFERDDRVGGLLIYGIPNMKLGKNLVARRVKLLRDSGINFQTNVNVGHDVSLEQIQKHYDAVVLTTGATKPRDLEVKNRGASGVCFAMDYLTRSTRLVLEAPKYRLSEDFNAKGKDVIVIGGGDTGTDCIATAVRQDARSLVNFEILEQPAQEREVANPWPTWPIIYRTDYGHAESADVYGSDPREFGLMVEAFNVDKEGHLNNLTTVGVTFENGQFKPIPNTTKVWPVQLAIIATGFLSPESYITANTNIELDARGNYKAAYGCFETTQSGIFSAGDCRRGQSLVVWAIHEGREAASKVDAYLSSF